MIIRTAAEGVARGRAGRATSSRLQAQWEDIEARSRRAGQAPQLLYEEPDLLIKVVRDLFTEDFTKLVVSG